MPGFRLLDAETFLRAPYGGPREETASGRATCRVCGTRITKGEKSVQAGHDFHGSGSHTATLAHAHYRCLYPGAT